jgi:hypothetical protein
MPDYTTQKNAWKTVHYVQRVWEPGLYADSVNGADHAEMVLADIVDTLPHDPRRIDNPILMAEILRQYVRYDMDGMTDDQVADMVEGRADAVSEAIEMLNVRTLHNRPSGSHWAFRDGGDFGLWDFASEDA